MKTCKVCEGDGWTVEHGHACAGDEEACEVLCPVAVQEICEACRGTGFEQDDCPHLHVTVYSRQLSAATREEPAEWKEWGECQECGKQLDITDIPEDAEIKQAGAVTQRSRQMPSEFYD
jgi:hypothetical protein